MLESIALLEKSLRLDPENNDSLAILIEKYVSIIELSLDKEKNNLALEYTERLSNHDPEKAAIYQKRAEARI